jgi:hypothetical protein
VVVMIALAYAPPRLGIDEKATRVTEYLRDRARDEAANASRAIALTYRELLRSDPSVRHSLPAWLREGLDELLRAHDDIETLREQAAGLIKKTFLESPSPAQSDAVFSACADVLIEAGLVVGYDIERPSNTNA